MSDDRVPRWGWAARQRARIGAAFMIFGSAIHPFDQSRALRIVASVAGGGDEGGD